MKHTPNTLNEEINRMKSLFTEERLYGNLVEQEEEKLKVQDSKGRTKEYSKEEVIEKIKKGKFTNDNVEVFVNKTLTPLVDIEWAKAALDGKNTDDFEDSFGKKNSLKKKKDKTEGGGGEKVKLKDKLAANKEERKNKNTCKDGIKIRLNKWIKSGKDGTEVSDKVIEEFTSNKKVLEKLKSCGETYKEDKEFLKLKGIGQFFIKLGLKGIFPEGEPLSFMEKAKDYIDGGGGKKFQIMTKDGNNQIATVVPGDIPTEYKVKGKKALLKSDGKLSSWVLSTTGWPEDVDVTNLKIKADSVSKNMEDFVIEKN
jgi:hypothetical protein